MLIRHLKFFVTLAQERHFGRAAARCNVTQPTLSLAIRKLEHDLNLPLIVRGHRFVSLTPEGEKALRWGRRILADYENLHEDLSSKKEGGLTGVLRLGAIPTAMPAIPFLSEAFSLRHPAAEIDLRAMSSQAIRQGLENFDIDGGVTYLENEPLSNVLRLPLYHERYVFACRADHPLAARERVTWAEAAAQPLCLLSEEMQNRRILNSIARDARVKLRPKIVSDSLTGVAAHVRSGLWCSIAPHGFAFLVGGAPDLVLREMIEPARKQLVGLVLADRAPQSPMSLALQDCAEKADLERRLDMGPPFA